MSSFRSHAPYMEWAKSRPSPRFDLAGSNVLACSIEDLPGAREALGFAGGNENGYPPLVEAIASRYGVPSSHVTTAQGASGANFLACAALLEPGDEVLVETPGYDPLIGTPRLLGAHVNRFLRDFAHGFALDPDRVRRALTPRTRLIVITSPHNPSGVMADRAALDEVGRIAEQHGARVLLDEVYLDASSVSSPIGPAHEGTAAARSEVFVCTNSLTKSYGLAGLRCGWILSSPEIAERIRRARDVVDGTGSIVAERLATLAFAHLDRLLERTRSLLETNGRLARQFLASRAEVEWIPVGGTVLFPRLTRVDDASAFADRLLIERATAVVPGRFFQAPQHFRLGFGGATEPLRGGLQAIGAALDELP
jgi:aspartate/methionine/tyrosine aminotransferase